ncbi:MAG: response regulator transcription factor [Chloroflexi bacterium]|nr:response regulator transcription factor [Chloroflexota bacterium]
MSELLRSKVDQNRREAGGGSAGAANPDLAEGLTPYLADLGLSDAHLAKLISLLEATQAEASPVVSPQRDGPKTRRVPEAPIFAPSAVKTVRLFVAEEQHILKEAYNSFFTNDPNIDMLGSTLDTSTDSLVAAVEEFQPEVVLLGVKGLRASVVDTLRSIRDACPTTAPVLLFAFYDAQGIKALKEFTRDTAGGRGFLLKHTIDTVEQLIQVVCSVAQGRIIVDPMVMEELVRSGDPGSGYLRELSPKALEVLSWMAKGYRNDTIADVLSRDVKTIERHINNIYSTLLDSDDDSRHPRVRAALMYLKATGLLSTDQLVEE